MYSKITQKKKNGNKNKDFLPINQYLIDTVDDIQTLPTQISKPIYERCSAGSTAYCIEDQNYYILNNSNEWLVFDESGNGNGNNSNSFSNLVRNDVTFYDYDGTIVASYSASDFMELDSLPENPNHTDEGLTSQGWNWNLTDAKAYVAKYGKLNVGQMYVPTDEKMHVFINISEDDLSYETALYFGHTTASGQTVINWGDDSPTETASGESAVEYSHTYANPGKYEVTLDTVTGVMSVIGTGNGMTEMHFAGPGNYARNHRRIEKIHLASTVSIGDFAFNYCYALQSVTIPEGVTSIGSSAFASCYALQNVTIPDSVTSIGGGVFNNCCALQSVTIPEGVTSIDGGAFSNCCTLQSATIPEGVTSIGSSAFYDCCALQSVTIPEGVTSIGDGVFQNCYTLQSVTIPDSVTSIGNSAFYFCNATIVYHFKPNTPPTLPNSAFYNISTDTVFYVPAASLETYKTATNWSTYADRIFAEPE